MQSQYSHSKLGAFRTCPRKYKFQYIEKVRIPERVSANLYMGAAVHRQVARAYSLGAEGVLYPLDEMIKTYHAEWERTGKEKIAVAGEYLTVEDYIRNGEKMLCDFYGQYQPFDQGTLLGVERRINFTLQRTPYKFIAIIDRLWRRDDGIVEIRDYKTNKNLPLGPSDPSFYNQMGLYLLGVRETYPQFEKIELVQHFLRHNELISCQMSPDQLDELAEQMRQGVLRTVHAERKDGFPTVEGGHCDYCEYFNLCPAKRHRVMLESEERAESEEKTTLASASDLANRYVELDTKIKTLKAEHDALKEDIIRAASEFDLSKLSGSEADVSVRSSREEKFISKTADESAFVGLTQLVRKWNLDDCLSLDSRALMKDYYLSERLKPEQLDELRKFIVESETHRVTVRRRKQDDTE